MGYIIGLAIGGLISAGIIALCYSDFFDNIKGDRYHKRADCFMEYLNTKQPMEAGNNCNPWNPRYFNTCDKCGGNWNYSLHEIHTNAFTVSYRCPYCGSKKITKEEKIR